MTEEEVEGGRRKKTKGSQKWAAKNIPTVFTRTIFGSFNGRHRA
jgi:hypothetical protein